jgi:hypothetical protein
MISYTWQKTLEGFEKEFEELFWTQVGRLGLNYMKFDPQKF